MVPDVTLMQNLSTEHCSGKKNAKKTNFKKRKLRKDEKSH